MHLFIYLSIYLFIYLHCFIVIIHFSFIHSSSYSTAHVFCHTNILLEVNKYCWMMVHNAHETCQKEHHECKTVVGMGWCRWVLLCMVHCPTLAKLTQKMTQKLTQNMAWWMSCTCTVCCSFFSSIRIQVPCVEHRPSIAALMYAPQCVPCRNDQSNLKQR